MGQNCTPNKKQAATVELEKEVEKLRNKNEALMKQVQQLEESNTAAKSRLTTSENDIAELNALIRTHVDTIAALESSASSEKAAAEGTITELKSTGLK